MGFLDLGVYVIPVIWGICLCMGFIIKKWIKDVDNKFIPTIACILGVILALWDNSWVVTDEVLLTGMASGLASTGSYEMVKQFIGKFIGKNNNILDYNNDTESEDDEV